MKLMWIEGKAHKGKGKAVKVVNPATEAVVDEVAEAAAADVDKAVAAARRGFERWRELGSVQKAELMHDIAQRFRAQAQALARILTLEGGKPLRENVDEIGWVASCFDYYAEIGRNSRGRVIPSIEPSQLAMVLKEPYGVVACIVPWNYPLLLMAWKAAPAIAAGNAVVIKPAEQTPLATLACAGIFGVLPEGLVNIVTGGPGAGEALVRHPGVDMVAFTGSLEVGKLIGKICMERMIKVHLELGGKDPFVVAEDADLDVAAKAVAWAAFLNTGQVCTSTERVYVQKNVYPEFLDRLTAFTKSLKLGPGLDPDTDIGPMIASDYRARVDAQVQEALKAGATLVTGGKAPEKMKKGWFYEPTVLTGVNSRMRVMRDETFGPVCPVAPYTDFDEAVRLANDTIYGLGAILYTKDPRKVKKFYEGVQAGTIWVNDPLTDNDAGPFGGFKATGGGRELGEEGLEEFRQSKHVHWDFEQQAKPWWYPYGKKKK